MRDLLIDKDQLINNCCNFKVAITLRVMSANKHWRVIDASILTVL